MFHFGSAEEQAAVYWSYATSIKGPLLPPAPLDELSVGDLRNALAYARIAYEAAEGEGAPPHTLQLLLARHDEVFEALAKADDAFRGRVLGTHPGRIIWLGGYSAENIAKYKQLASAS